MNVSIRSISSGDALRVWSILEPIIRAAETYALARDLGQEEALAFWCSPKHEVFVAESNGDLVGTYYLKANHEGGGSHVANCGYATSPTYNGHGVATAMCLHSLTRARERGFQAMQYNLVVGTNRRAVALWERHGFAIVGRIPQAFLHPVAGFTEAYVMHRML